MSDITVFISGADGGTLAEISDAGAAIDKVFAGIDDDITKTLALLSLLSQPMKIQIDDSGLDALTDEVNELEGSMDMLAAGTGNDSVDTADTADGSVSATAEDADGSDGSDGGDGGDDGLADAGSLMPADSLDDQMAGMSDMLDMLGTITNAMDSMNDSLLLIPDEMQVVVDLIATMALTADSLTGAIESNRDALGNISGNANEGKTAFKEFADKADDFNHVMDAAKNIIGLVTGVNTLFAASEVAVTGATAAETIALGSLEVVLLAFPFALIIGAIGLLAYKLMGSKDGKGKAPDTADNPPAASNEKATQEVQQHSNANTSPEGNKAAPEVKRLSPAEREVLQRQSDHLAADEGKLAADMSKSRKTKKKDVHKTSSHQEHNSQQRVVNINYNSPLYKVDHQTFATIKDAIDEFEPKVKEAMLRILASVPGLQ